jgi:hypothetical protein
MSGPPPPPRRSRGAGDPEHDPIGDYPAPPPPQRTPPPPGSEPPPGSTATVPIAPSGPTRSQRRAASDDGNGGGPRWGLILGIIAVVLLVGVGAAFAAGAFSSSGGGGESAPTASTNVNLKMSTKPGDVATHWPGDGPAPADSALPNQVLGVIGQYIDQGVVPALRTGKVTTAKLSSTFDQNALTQLDGTARAALLDEGLPPAVGEIKIISDPVKLRVLKDQDGKTLFAAAAIHFDIQVTSDKGKYTVTRKGYLVMSPDQSGKLKVDGWDLKTYRTPLGHPKILTTTTTAKSGKAGTSTKKSSSSTSTTASTAPQVPTKSS